MTRQKSFKTRVRTRMTKTGESYTTARRQLLEKSGPSATATDPATPATTPDPTPTMPAPAASPAASPATSPGFTASMGAPAPPGATDSALEAAAVRAQQLPEEAVRERTGRPADEWFALLDAWGAAVRTHTEIAHRLVEVHQVDGWWAQSITVAYEQSRGLRAPGQKADGSFSIGATKTVAVPVERLFAAFDDSALRRQWLPDATVRVRTSTAPKSFRADWAEDGTRIVVAFVPKGEAKAQVAVEHTRLPDGEAGARMKAYWRERLAELKRLLES
ncbi:hypothetical protein QNO07_23580 [Streptomyces sp. 549]|uniref:hypothetical protein n=1 Tax=Streptomyces sp. 549 TaxID=3049076 RepID=UPI0024C42D6C|nr:hypothetical protein [Streptomyces sp. 549]MDK1476359.1 hypothetical protein [Streptomyces sp. 549]